MIAIILNKVLLVVFFMACLNTIRHAYYFVQAFFETSEGETRKYILNKTSLFILGASIAFILSAIFSGIQI